MNFISSILSEYPFLSVILSFCFAFILMPLVVKVAVKKKFVVVPNGRTAHKGAVPNVGGINIFSAWFFTVIFCIVPSTHDIYIFAGMYVMMMVGLLDDLAYTSPKKKLVGEIFSGILLIGLANMKCTHLLGFLGVTTLPLFVSYILTFFIFIVIVNAVNLIDGVDGLASGLGMVCSLFFGLYFYLTNRPSLAVMAFSLVGSLMVFFLYNVYNIKKKIFMGDCGSLVLGYLYTYFILQFCEANAYNLVPEKLHFSAAPVVSALVLTVPLFDTLRVFITRIKHGKSPFRPDKNHIHHLLLRLGFSHKQTSYTLMGVNILFIGLGIAGRNWNMVILLLAALLIAVLLMVFVWLKVRRVKTEININH